MNKMEYIKVLIEKDNINFIKLHGSFAKFINTIIELVKEDTILLNKLKNKMSLK